MGKYQGVILAAGHGSRMGPFGEQVPKPVAPICNKPLMAYQLDHMRALGIEDVLIVIGHLGHRITQVLGDGEKYGVRIQYVEQERRLGLAHAVGQLEKYLKNPFLLILGDIFYEAPHLGQMLETFEATNAGAVLAVMEETDVEAVKKNFNHKYTKVANGIMDGKFDWMCNDIYEGTPPGYLKYKNKSLDAFAAREKDSIFPEKSEAGVS